MIVSTRVGVVGRGRSSFSSEERAGRSGVGPGRVVRGRMGCDYYILSRLPKSAPPRHLNFHVPLSYEFTFSLLGRASFGLAKSGAKDQVR